MIDVPLWDHEDGSGSRATLLRTALPGSFCAIVVSEEPVWLDRTAAQGLYDALRDLLASTPPPGGAA